MAATHHPVFSEPADLNVLIWRYMDFTKFVSMLVRRGLFFSRIDRLGDPFEGSFPEMNTRDDMFVPRPEIEGNPKKIKEELSGAKLIRQVTKHMRPWWYANCWHMSECESAAMWKTYARTEEAVCILSTFKKLSNVLPKKAHVGCVKYIDYSKNAIALGNMALPFIHKRMSFEHEREIRALIVNNNGNTSWLVKQGVLPQSTELPILPEGGVWQDVDLVKLIDKVYVAPTAPNWFKETVEQTIQKFGFEFPVVQSSLDDSPVW